MTTNQAMRPMTSKERFLCALMNGQPDRVPLFDFLFTPTIYTVTIGRTPADYNSRDAMDCTFALGLDSVWIPFGGYQGWQAEFLDQNIYKDEWGTTYKQDLSIAWPIDAPVDYPIKTRADLAKYTCPDPTRPGRLDPIKEAVSLNSKEVAILGGVQGPFTTAWLLMGPTNLLMNMYDDPSFVEEIFKISNEFFIEAGKRMWEAGVDAIVVGDDYGHKGGTFISPQQYRRHVRPYFDEIVQTLRDMGIPILLHCCGNSNAILDQLVDSGINGLHPLQRTANMDIKFVKETYGHRISICGNIDSSVTLPYGTPEEVEQEVIDTLRVAAPGGGYILASDHSLHDGIPVQNIFRMFQTAKKYGTYPLQI